MENDQTLLWVVAIVAVVGIIALVMVAGSVSANVPTGAVSGQTTAWGRGCLPTASRSVVYMSTQAGWAACEYCSGSGGSYFTGYCTVM